MDVRHCLQRLSGKSAQLFNGGEDLWGHNTPVNVSLTDRAPGVRKCFLASGKF